MPDTASNNLIEAVQQDHREVERMLEAVESASGDVRRDAFSQLVEKLKAHEAAEQQVVHPLTTELGDADEAAALKAEESAAEKAIKELEGLDVDSPEFESGFARLRSDVLEHAEEEEREEHPLILSETSDDELQRRGAEFEKAEQAASEG